MAAFRPESSDFPDDFPRRIERLREASGVSWQAFADELRVSVRTVHRWRRGSRPDAAHLLALLDYAAELGRLNHILEPAHQAGLAQGLLFDEVTWKRIQMQGAAQRHRAA